MRRLSKPSDLWQVGIAEAPMAHFLQPQRTAPRIHWLPSPGPFRFLADPFGHCTANGMLTVLVEAFDYRTKHGEIHYYTLDPAYQVTAHGVALRAAHHLSYPYLIEDAGELYMLPECSRSGELALYRAVSFPERWEKVATLLTLPAIDASVVRHAGRYWMFFSLPGENLRPLRELHAAYADQLRGPWHVHPANPIQRDLAAGRMGGTPFLHEGALHLPLQDARGGYGSALQLMRIDTLSPTEITLRPAHAVTADDFASPYRDGTHTLSACGDVTLFDVKQVYHSPARRLIDLERRARRWLRLA